MKHLTHKSIKLLAGFVLLAGLNQAVWATEPDTFRLRGPMVVSDALTLMNGPLLNTDEGELYLGEHSPRRNQTNELHITGGYVGEEGSKLFVSVTDNSNLPNTRGYMDIIGAATRIGKGTFIDLDYTNSAWGWDGSCIDLVRAEKTDISGIHTDVETFYFPDNMSPMNSHIPILRHREFANDVIWFLAEKLTDGINSGSVLSACLNDANRKPALSVKMLTNPVNCLYQWYRCDADGANLVYLGNANGAQTPTYMPPLDVSGINYYRCIVTSLTCAFNSDTTDVSEAIEIGTPVQIVQHPVSRIVARGSGETHVLLSVVASGSGLSYKWYRDGVVVTGEENPNLLVDISDGNIHSYYVEVSGCDATLASDIITAGYCRELIVQIRNHTLTVNNNSATNGGHTFVYYAWYKDGAKIWEGTPDAMGNYYYTGSANLDFNAEYSVVLKDIENRTVTACAFVPAYKVPVTEIKVYPSVIASKNNEPTYLEVITENDIVEEATIDAYNAIGWKVGTFKSTSRMTRIELPNITGVYILKYVSVSGVEHEAKVIVK